MPEELAPPVVAVVATSDPGEWFETCLASLGAQDYPNLALLVVDDGGVGDLTLRVGSVAPLAIVRRRAVPGGYPAAANEALVGVEGASYFLFCHDDVELDERAVTRLVEESFRSNAGVVGPKVLRADDPRVLLEVGLGMRRLGQATPRVEPGELDQSQHDEARDVFAVPGGCMLVRADLFAALGGFDEELSTVGEDVDLCWRAQVLGARVAVAPRARVRHRQSSRLADAAGGEGTAALRRSAELRAALKNYGRWRRWPVLLELLLVSLAGFLLALSSREGERAREISTAWRWNLRRRSSLRTARRLLDQARQVPDRALVRRMATRGFAKALDGAEGGRGAGRWPTFSRYGAERSSDGALALTGPGGARGDGHPRFTPAGPHRLASWWAEVRTGQIPPGQLFAAAAVAAFSLLGLRDVLFAPLPFVGQFQPFPAAWTMLGHFFGGVPVGASVRPAPTGYGIVGLLGLLLGNSSAVAWKLICVGALVAGAIGVSLLCRPFLSGRGRLAALIAFAASPLVWNSVATGDVRAAVTLGAMPYVLIRLARAATLPGTPSPRAFLGEALGLGLLLAFTVALAPPALLAVGAALLAVVVGSLLARSPRSALRAAAVTAAAAVVAWCCCFPWSLTWVGAGARWSAFSGAVPGSVPGPGSLLRGHVGPIGAWWGAWGIAAAAAYALLVARHDRLRWAATWWLAAIASVALAYAGGRGWLGQGGGDFTVLAAPAAVALAAACGIGAAAFERDVTALPGLGWRHAFAGLGALCLAVGVLPALAVTFGGRSDLPTQGIRQTLGWAAAPSGHPYRTLWIGDPRALPASGWELSPGVAWFVSTGVVPGGPQQWPAASPAASQDAGPAVSSALLGQTANLGVPLARLGVRYIVVPVADAASLPGSQSAPVAAPPRPALLSALQSQADLVERPVEAGAYVFENAAWTKGGPPGGFGLPLAPGSSPFWREVGVGAGVAAWLLVLVGGVLLRRRLRSLPASSGEGAGSGARAQAGRQEALGAGEGRAAGSEASPYEVARR